MARSSAIFFKSSGFDFQNGFCDEGAEAAKLKCGTGVGLATTAGATAGVALALGTTGTAFAVLSDEPDATDTANAVASQAKTVKIAPGRFILSRSAGETPGSIATFTPALTQVAA